MGVRVGVYILVVVESRESEHVCRGGRGGEDWFLLPGGGGVSMGREGGRLMGGGGVGVLHRRAELPSRNRSRRPQRWQGK